MTMHLVLGGAGFLGRHVVRSLLMRGDEVTVADRTYFPALCDLPPPKVVMIDLARATGSELDDLVSSADVIHNYAWSTIPQTANADPLADLVGNVGLVIKLSVDAVAGGSFFLRRGEPFTGVCDLFLCPKHMRLHH